MKDNKVDERGWKKTHGVKMGWTIDGACCEDGTGYQWPIQWRWDE